jgi:hypothetical protein
MCSALVQARGLGHSEAVQILIERKEIKNFSSLTPLSPYPRYPEDFLKKGTSNFSEFKTSGGESIGNTHSLAPNMGNNSEHAAHGPRNNDV